MAHVVGRLSKSEANLAKWHRAHATPESIWASFASDLASMDTKRRAAATGRLMEMGVAELRTFCEYVNGRKTDKSVRRGLQPAVCEVLDLFSLEPQSYQQQINLITTELLR